MKVSKIHPASKVAFVAAGIVVLARLLFAQEHTWQDRALGFTFSVLMLIAILPILKFPWSRERQEK